MSFFVMVVPGNGLMSPSEMGPGKNQFRSFSYAQKEVPEKSANLSNRQADRSPRCALKRARLPFLICRFFLTASLALPLSTLRSA